MAYGDLKRLFGKKKRQPLQSQRHSLWSVGVGGKQFFLPWPWWFLRFWLVIIVQCRGALPTFFERAASHSSTIARQIVWTCIRSHLVVVLFSV